MGRGREGLNQMFLCLARMPIEGGIAIAANGKPPPPPPQSSGVEVVGKLVGFVVLVMAMAGGAIVEGIVALDLVGQLMQLCITGLPFLSEIMKSSCSMKYWMRSISMSMVSFLTSINCRTFCNHFGLTDNI